MTLFGFSALQTSAGVLLALVIVLILTGRLVSRRQMLDRLSDRDVQIRALQRQSDMWQHAYETAMAAQRQTDSHVGVLMEAARTTTHVLNALPSITQFEADPDATHVA
jgi:hypothetical protein